MSAATTKKRARTKPKKSPASEIAPGVFVGGWDDATRFTGARFCVLDELPAEGAPADRHVRIYDDDGEGPLRANLDRLAGLVDDARSRGEPVLLFCGHGVRRSPLAGAWYLHRHDRIPLDEAYGRIRSVRPGVEHVRAWARHWEALADAAGPGARR